MEKAQPQNYNQMNQNELIANINSALSEAPPSDIMTGKIWDEIMYYLTPIIIMIGFVLIIVFGVFPNISLMIDKVNTVNAIKEEDSVLSEKIAKLEVLRSNLDELTFIIEKINAIVPEGQTEVVKFSQRIRDAVSIDMVRFVIDEGEPPITMNEIKTGELALATINSNIEGLKINQIPTKFNFSGGFGRFRQFFINLYNSTDFFVVEEMQLSYDSTLKQWNGEVSLVKYQFSKDDGFEPTNVYGSISENAQADESVISFLESKYIDNKLD